jgi:hypothetical protein
MRFHLASHLQEQFRTRCPQGWDFHRERHVLDRDLEETLGYEPRADVMLERRGSGERIWIELEISRADPVANHAKFGSAHLLEPFPRRDAFVSLVSRHVVRGRSNLAAHTVYLLRSLGVRAFQMPLFPELDGQQVSALNQGRAETVEAPSFDIGRMIELTKGVGESDGTEIYFATNPFEVMLNLTCWNRDIADPQCRERWGRRRITYFVYDPRRGQFAPSKFCAYSAMPAASGRLTLAAPMDVATYTRIDALNPIFDGNRAWRHLLSLGCRKAPLRELGTKELDQFERWLESTRGAVDADAATAEALWFED